MVAKRFLSGLAIATMTISSAWSQSTQPSSPPANSSLGTGVVNSTGTAPPYYTPANAGATQLLTTSQSVPTPPMNPQYGQSLPPGTVLSPWSGGRPAGAQSDLSIGANGPVGYEVYLRTGPAIVVGGDPELSGSLKTGWMVDGGGRTLFFNTTGDSAWALDLGVSYTYNPGDLNRIVGVATPPAPFFDNANPQDPRNGQVGADQINAFNVRALHRTSFNFAIGRNWWMNGPGNLGGEFSSNTRWGIDVGGRWGSTHVHLIPANDPDQYLRRTSVFHGIFIGSDWNTEIPLGAWIGFIGARLEWGYDWTNVVPPIGGDVQNVNLLLSAGVRF